jgi:type IV pilus assembly protein PilE
VKRYDQAVTLIEILVVMVIVGILATLALPRFLRVQVRVKASEARGMLKAALVLEKAYYSEHGCYTASLEDVGFIQTSLVTDQPPGPARYRLDVPIATEMDLRVTATSVVDFDGDGQYSVWIIDQSGSIDELVGD